MKKTYCNKVGLGFLSLGAINIISGLTIALPILVPFGIGMALVPLMLKKEEEADYGGVEEAIGKLFSQLKRVDAMQVEFVIVRKADTISLLDGLGFIGNSDTPNIHVSEVSDLEAGIMEALASTQYILVDFDQKVYSTVTREQSVTVGEMIQNNRIELIDIDDFKNFAS